MTIRVNDIVRLLPGEEERDADIDGLVMSIDEDKKMASVIWDPEVFGGALLVGEVKLAKLGKQVR